MRRLFLLCVSTLAVGGLLGLTGSASAQQVVSVSVGPNGNVVASGQAAVVRVAAACEAPFEVLEANLSLSQGAASGFTGFGGLSCDGKTHKLRVTVPADEGTSFAKGTASASAFLLVINPSTQQTQQAQATATITLR